MINIILILHIDFLIFIKLHSIKLDYAAVSLLKPFLQNMLVIIKFSSS